MTTPEQGPLDSKKNSLTTTSPVQNAAALSSDPSKAEGIGSPNSQKMIEPPLTEEQRKDLKKRRFQNQSPPLKPNQSPPNEDTRSPGKDTPMDSEKHALRIGDTTYKLSFYEDAGTEFLQRWRKN